ncbi:MULTISPECIES: hypothetical protein [Pedobacter]|uniref:hypothetical protein n=1 Tax=Pedobacter TaxID=84567 RepID=UPI002930985B|nr:MULTISPECIES: hypothetical protein [Pedobacter]
MINKTNLAVIVLLIVCISGCKKNRSNQTEVDADLKVYLDEEKIENSNLLKFDSLDYVGFTGRNLPVFEAMHDAQVHVEWSGFDADNLAKHESDLLNYYNYLAIGDGVIAHPIRIANGQWTAVVALSQSTVAGSFTKRLTALVTVAKWKNGKITEEYLFSRTDGADSSRLKSYSTTNNYTSANYTSPTGTDRERLAAYIAMDDSEKRNLTTFDNLDFIGWTQRNLSVFNSAHDENVYVEWSGNNATSLNKHTADAERVFTFLQPGDGVTSHPVKIAQGDWTAVIGLTSSTNAATSAKTIGALVTIAKWRNGKIVEEYLFNRTSSAENSLLNSYR